MTDSKKVLLTGVRESKLSIAQAEQAIDRLHDTVSCCSFELAPMSSPGDRDRASDLRETAPDFFTRDLDDAVISGKIECAIHSAKDLPDKLNQELDFFYLPWYEDRRDVLIYPRDRTLPEKPVIGISSERRAEYCRKRFPEAEPLSVRGNIEQRIAQLDAGEYDILILAAAGLNRLGLSDRISEYISLDELPVPDGQGYLAVTFRKDDLRFLTLRQLFLKSVVIAGACGSAEHTTDAVITALKKCSVCLYDALAPQELLKILPPETKAVYTGKRYGCHSMPQNEISELIAKYAKTGKKVVRLKGGDPGIFGRLSEEISLLNSYQIPYRVLPGISSMALATTATGLLPVRRNICRGFSVMTPRKAGSHSIEWFSSEEEKGFTKLFFMGASEIKAVSENLISDGYNPEMPVSVVFNAGAEDEKIKSSSLKNIAKCCDGIKAPGIIIAGKCADSRYLYRSWGALGNRSVLITSPLRTAEKIAEKVKDYGGRPLIMPMIELSPLRLDKEIFAKFADADWIIVPSPSATSFFFEALKNFQYDLRKLSGIAVCGPETGDVLKKYGIYPDLYAEEPYGTEGLLKAFRKIPVKGETIIRISSDKAGSILSDSLRAAGAEIIDVKLYSNRNVSYDSVPEFDTVLFSSPSTVTAFAENFDMSVLNGKTAAVIGEPTFEKLKSLSAGTEIIKGESATAGAMVDALAAVMIEKQLTTLTTGD